MAPTPPKSRFNSHSTAEAVTAGIDLSGKTALVTGCASGIGFETMRVLALRGATVIGAARTLEGARAACANVAGKTHAVGCELADLGSIAACSDAALALAPQLDMLICNAGIMAPPKLTLVRGLELQFATNHIGHYLLVRRLLESVKAAPQGRIVMLSSLAHRFVPKGGIDFDNLSAAKGYSASRAYGQSKLANLLTATALARRLQGTRATANAVHPGSINTNLMRFIPAHKLLSSLFDAMMKTVHQGAATSCYAATAPALAEVSGLYFVDCNPLTPSRFARDPHLAERLWAVSEELVAPYL